MRKCTQCGVEFEPTTRKGYRCPPCRKAYDKAWREERKAKGLPTGGGKMPRDYHKAYEEAYRQQPDVKERLRDRARARRTNPAERHKHVARWKVNHAVASGRLVRKPCEVCGSPRSQAHHPDYSKPLDVIWLCAPHHAAEHAKAEGGAS